jgi:hypothetical protein
LIEDGNVVHVFAVDAQGAKCFAYGDGNVSDLLAARDIKVYYWRGFWSVFALRSLRINEFHDSLIRKMTEHE